MKTIRLHDTGVAVEDVQQRLAVAGFLDESGVDGTFGPATAAAVREFCRAAGMNASVAVNMFVKAVLKNQRIPFAITGDPFYSPANMRHLRHAVEQAEQGQLEKHELIEVDDA